MHRRFALGGLLRPPRRRHFSMTPDTRYPVLGSEALESVARELGSSGAGRVGDDGWMRMPRNRAERGLGARLVCVPHHFANRP